MLKTFKWAAGLHFKLYRPLTFVDFNKDEAMAKLTAEKLDLEQTKLLLMQTYHEVTKNYEKDYNNVKLIKGKPTGF